MKSLLVIFAIYITYVLCEGNKIAVKSFPNKVRPYGNGKILINSARYGLKPEDKTTTNANKYTVFQSVGLLPKTLQGVPDSPYFQVDQGFVHKPRVKKVLPDFPWSSLRSKRSAVLNASPVEKDDKTETTIENRVKSTVEKIMENTPTPMPTTPANLVQEKEIPARKSDLSRDKPIEEAKEVKKEIKDTIKENTESETKTETTSDKTLERSGKTKPSTKSQNKGDAKSAKKVEPKTLKLVDARSNNKSPSKSDGKGDKKTNSSNTLKSHKKGLQSKSRPAPAKDKSKGEGTNVERANRKKKSKSTVNSSDAATNIKGKSKDKGKNAIATNVRAKSKDKVKKTNVAKVRAKGDETPTKNKKNDTNTKGNTETSNKKGKKRKGNTNKASPQRSKNRSRPKKGQKFKPMNGTRTGKKPKAQRRLISGREALIEDYPYVVSIQKNEQHWCSGALLNPRLVITTANCLWKANRISRMQVRVGSRYVDRGGQMAGIQEVMKHPGWGLRRNPDNDVALILLDRNVKFTDAVHGVDLPNRVMLPPFDDAWVTSWGAERRDGVYDVDSSSLQVYHTRLMDRDKCNNVTMRFSVVVTENFICLSQSGRTAPCTRDTGAPAVSDGILWGLASWGIRKLCGIERFPSVFSYLASHSNLDFITNATRFLMSDKRFYPYADRFPNIQSSAERKK